MKVVAFIPLRNNSKRVKDKNNQVIGEKNLVQHITDRLVDVDGIDDIYLYTSDETYIEGINKNVLLKRRCKSLDSDETKGLEIYSSFVSEIYADIYILVHATSPFIKPETFEIGISAIRNGEYDSAFTVEEIKTFCWYDGKPINYDLDNVVQTQKLQPILVETSGYYMFRRNVIESERRIGEKPKMVTVTHAEAIDIDEYQDLELARRLV
ncbi:acylneuraminate cytidylyltransferase family protein [Vibrio sp. 1CM8B]|uniref:acylneuraminate cytidylyltransferase family protein n=1 Tax=Vibrio sp. 1CM8B TaxID=2929167 RepID=UPI0020BF354B|nr:acylneuraminate cytidylyltransferase family protein [Vibrio sp. 1CM8B]MCK8087078.1 acylneuraminate cytidylyltransferase family protein [Vibrio sp. 1CM8B]